MYWRRLSIQDGQAFTKTPLFWNGFSAITSLLFVIERKEYHFGISKFFYVPVCLYANFQFLWLSRDHFSAPFRVYICQMPLHRLSRLAKGTPSESRLSIGTIGLGKTVSCRLCAGQSKGTLKREKKCVFTGRMPRSGKLPVLNLLTGQKSGFSPHRGDSLHRFTSNLAGPTGTWSPLLCKISPQSPQGLGMRPQKYQKFAPFGKESPRRAKPFDRLLELFYRLLYAQLSCISVSNLTWFASPVTALL